MRGDFLIPHIFAQKRNRLGFVALCVLIGLGVCGIVFLSPGLVLASTLAIVLLISSFISPQAVLFLLLVYLPFEPFLLKWIPDSVYVFVRYGSEALVYVLAAIIVIRVLLGTMRLRPTPLDLPFVIFCLLILASIVLNAVPPVVAILGTRQIIRFILLFFIVSAVEPSRAWVKNLCVALIVIAAFQSGLGIMQRLSGGAIDDILLPAQRKTLETFQLTTGTNQFWDPGARVFGTLGRYDQLGTFLAITLLLAVAFLYERGSKNEYHLPVYAFLFLGILALGLTLSRSGWFGFLLGFLFITVVMKRDKLVAMAAVIVPVLLVSYVLISGLAVNRLLDSPSQNAVERFFEAFSADRWRGEYAGYARLYWIVRTVDTVVPAAPLFGWGPGQYGAGAVAALQNTTVYDTLGLPFGVYGTGGYIDNNWFSLWGETGTLGMLAFLWLWGTGFFVCVAVAREGQTVLVRTVALGTGGMFIAISLNAFLASMLEVRTLAPYLWVMTGCVVVLGRRERILE